jgi:VanZ family protein
MVNKEWLSLPFLRAAFILILIAMIFAGLYPFSFFPPNRVRWLSNEPGLYFDGAGIAYTDRVESISIKNALSIELWLKERRGSKNWGPREIFSFYDGCGSPSFLVGQWAGQIFVYSRLEKNKGQKWYRLFRSRHRFPRGQACLVTVTFDEREKAIYIDGQLDSRKSVALRDRSPIEFSGCLLLGNSPRGKNGWFGEIRGLALYDRILEPDEIAAHSSEVSQKGVGGLADTHGCLALYLFDEGSGNTARSILNKPRLFSIPVNLNALGFSLLGLPHKDMRFYDFNRLDFLKNFFFFVPFGVLLSAIILKKYAIGHFTIFLLVALAGGLLSCTIESFQLFLPPRAPGVSDMLSNVLGSGFGVLVNFTILKFKS